MQLIDLHVDTLTALYTDVSQPARNEFADLPVQGLRQNNLHVDVTKLKAANSLAQFWVLWLNLHNCHKYQVTPWQHFCKLQQQFCQQLELNQDQLLLARNLKEIEVARTQGKIASLIAVEEGGFITELSQLEQAQKLGVSYITLVWNYETHIGVPAAIDQKRGLTTFGCEMVQAMQQLGIIVDVSHLSDQGTREVLSLATRPIIASHSNARAQCDHYRNLPDALIRGIAANGGVIGVNFVPYFLAANLRQIRRASIIANLQHLYQIGGEDVLAIGSDFDGFSPLMAGDELTSSADIPLLVADLEQAGFSPHQIEKIFYANCLRVCAASLDS